MLRPGGHGFHRRQPGTGMGHVRTQQVRVIRKDLAAFAATRNADVKLLLMDGGQRAGRGHDQHGIHSLALGGVGRDGVAMGERAVMGGQHPAIGQQHCIPLNGFDFN